MSNLKKIARKVLEQFWPDALFARKSYAQDGEDLLVQGFFETQKGYRGFYVDVGAHHPWRFSNTAFFYKRGWRGINIEPSPDLFGAFKRLRSRDINLNLGIGSETGELTFFVFNEPALNSFDANLSQARDQDPDTNYRIERRLSLVVRPLAEVLKEHLPKGQRIDLMSIDVEGLDLAVLQSNDWESFRPRYLLVEDAVNFDHLADSDLYRYLRPLGYALVGRTLRTFLFEDERGGAIDRSGRAKLKGEAV